MRVNDQIYNMSLPDILKLETTNNICAIALAKSRNQAMTPELALLLSSIISKANQSEGGKWLEVAARLLRNNFQTGFKYTIENPILLQPLISTVMEQQPSSIRYHQHQQLILQHLSYNLQHKSNSSVAQQILHTMRQLSLYLQLATKFQCTQYLEQIVYILCRFSISVDCLLRWIQDTDGIAKIVLHQASIRFFMALMQALRAVQDIVIRTMKVGQFLFVFGEAGQPNTLRYVIQQKLLPISYFLLHPPSTCTQYILCLYQIILDSTQSPHLQQAYLHLTPLIQNIEKLSKKVEILKLNKHQNVNSQLMAINQQINSSTYSDTLAGLHMAILVSLAQINRHFFHRFVSQVKGEVKGKRDVVEVLIKVGLLADVRVVRRRGQEVVELMEFVISVVEGCYGSYNQWQQLQVIQFILNFIGKLPYQKKNPQYQKTIQKCLNFCFCLLHKTPTQQLQSHCLSILQQLPTYPKLLPILRNLLPQILNNFLTIQNPTIQVLQLLQTYLIQIPELIQRSATFLINYCVHVFNHELRKIDGGQVRVKGSLGVNRVLAVFAAVLGRGVQLGFEDIQDKIVHQILYKLLQPHTIQYDEDLLHILNLILKNYSHLTPSTLQLLSKLRVLYEHNNKKLSTITQILTTIVTNKEVRKQIIYQYHDFIVMILNMVEDYFTALSWEQWLYYEDQIRALMWALVAFFLEIFPDVAEVIGGVCWQIIALICAGVMRNIKQVQIVIKQKISSTLSSNQNVKTYFQFHQLLLQLALTLSHVSLAPSASPFNLNFSTLLINIIKETPMQKYIYLETMKMTPIILIQRALLGNQLYQAAVKDVVDFCQYAAKIQIEMGMSREWGKIKGVEVWESWPWGVKTYVEGVIKELLNRRVIDRVDYSHYIQQINGVLRG